MVKKVLISLLCVFITPFLCGCEHKKIVTSTGGMGQRVEMLKKYTPVSTSKNSVTSGKNVIYLGREYENNHFGPTGIKFKFEK